MPGKQMNSTKKLKVNQCNHGRKCFFQDLTAVKDQAFLEDALTTTEATTFKHSSSDVTTKHVIRRRMAIDDSKLPSSLLGNILVIKSAKNSNSEISSGNCNKPNHKTVEEFMRECDEFGIVCRENELVPILDMISRPKIFRPPHEKIQPTSSAPATNTIYLKNNVCSHHMSEPPSSQNPSGQFSLPNRSKDGQESDASRLSSTSVDNIPLSTIPDQFGMGVLRIEYPNTFSTNDITTEESVNFKLNASTHKNFRLKDITSTCVHFKNRIATALFARAKSSVTPSSHSEINNSKSNDFDKDYDTIFHTSSEYVITSPQMVDKCSRHNMNIQNRNQSPLKTTPIYRSSSAPPKIIYMFKPSSATKPKKTELSTVSGFCEHREAELEKDLCCVDSLDVLSDDIHSDKGKWKIRNILKNDKKPKKKKKEK